MPCLDYRTLKKKKSKNKPYQSELIVKPQLRFYDKKHFFVIFRQGMMNLTKGNGNFRMYCSRLISTLLSSK